MSLKLAYEVWQLADLEHAERTVLRAMAEVADDDGRKVYPSIGYLAYKSDYSERQVQRAIQTLIEKGLVVVVSKGSNRTGSRRTNEYRLAFQDWPHKSPYRAKHADDVQLAPDQPSAHPEPVQSEREPLSLEEVRRRDQADEDALEEVLSEMQPPDAFWTSTPAGNTMHVIGDRDMPEETLDALRSLADEAAKHVSVTRDASPPNPDTVSPLPPIYGVAATYGEIDMQRDMLAHDADEIVDALYDIVSPPPRHDVTVEGVAMSPELKGLNDQVELTPVVNIGGKERGSGGKPKEGTEVPNTNTYLLTPEEADAVSDEVKKVFAQLEARLPRSSKKLEYLEESQFHRDGVTDAMRAWAETFTPSADIGRQWDLFSDHYQSSGKRSRNWFAEWRNWMRRSEDFDAGNGRGRTRSNGPGPGSGHPPNRGLERDAQSARAKASFEKYFGPIKGPGRAGRS